MNASHDKGFTILELLVVIAIIGILATVILASLANTRSIAATTASLEFDRHVYHALGDTLQAAWLFDECGSAGATVVQDSSGNNINGTIYGTPSWDTSTYAPSSKCALDFNGTSNYVNFPTTPNIDNGSFTVSSWIKRLRTSWSANEDVVSKNWPIIFLRSSNYVYCEFPKLVTSLGLTSVRKITDNNWHNIVCTYDVTTNVRNIYIDGTLDNTGIAAGPLSGSNSSPWQLSNSVSYGTNFLYGVIDDVRVYSSAITAEAVGKLYAEGLEKHKLLFARN